MWRHTYAQHYIIDNLKIFCSELQFGQVNETQSIFKFMKQQLSSYNSGHIFLIVCMIILFNWIYFFSTLGPSWPSFLFFFSSHDFECYLRITFLGFNFNGRLVSLQFFCIILILFANLPLNILKLESCGCDFASKCDVGGKNWIWICRKFCEKNTEWLFYKLLFVFSKACVFKR